jgi:terminal uridylyltransferase
VKEDVRKLLERLIRTIEPESRLLSFGSTANGFSLRNSGPSAHAHIAFKCGGIADTPIPDMDLCCLIDSDERTTASNLVTLLGDLLERGKAPRPNNILYVAHLIALRNQVSRQTSASCSDTYC